jgi:hypothetical protein
MWRTRWLVCTGLGLGLLGGCATGPLVEHPALVGPAPGVVCENPLYIPLGPSADAYARVFEQVLDVVDDYFEILYSNRYDGRIETYPRISPGLEQPWKPGSPDLGQRLEATLQTVRRRSLVLIHPADDGGYFVNVTVFKELEDLARPIRATAGAASFRSDNTVERQAEVIDPTVFETNWIPLGRDTHLEQVLLQRLKKCM